MDPGKPRSRQLALPAYFFCRQLCMVVVLVCAFNLALLVWYGYGACMVSFSTWTPMCVSAFLYWIPLSHNHRLECGLGGRLLFHQQRRPLSVLLLLMDRHSISPSKYYSLFSLSLPFLLSRILPAIFCVWTGSHEAGRGEWERRKLKSGQVIPLCSRLSSMLSNCARVFHFTISACSRTSGCALGCLVVVYVWWRASSRVLVSCVCVFAVVWWLATTGTVSLIPTTAIYFRGQSMVDVAVAYFRFFLIISYSCIIHPHFTISWLWSIVFNCEC
jgi:hypothetical protein